ncbi:MAG: transglycosylase domain-containing protein [Lachnospiraceae bacterium]|nr:transglycosylase domain-containing protein [Lachnospiraceae bacterium]
MNYSHYNIIRKQKYLKSPVRRFYSMLRIWLFRIALVGLVFIIVAGSFSAYGAYQGAISTAPSIDGIDVHPDMFSSKIYYPDGREIVELVGAGTNKIYAPIDSIPQKVRDTFVAMEDERFYQHRGIDVRGIFRAAFSVVKVRGLKYGASTITQQLLKNQVFGGGNERSSVDKLVRKVQEQYLAVKLEDKMDKETILEYYLNTINLGNGAFGIGDAAQRYFGKDVSELTISEAAVIAPVAYFPSGMNPLRHEEDNRRRREDCLNNMLKAGLCTQEEYDEAIADTDDVYLRLQRQAEITDPVSSQQYSYFVDELIEQLLDDLQAKGYSAQAANSLLYTGGLRIYTTQDRQVQDILDSYFTNEEYFPKIKSGSYYELAKTYALSFVSTDGKITKHYHLNDLLKYYSNYKDSSKLFYHKNGSTGISVYTTDYEKFGEMIDEFKEAMTEQFEKDNPGVKYNEPLESRAFSIQPQCAMVIMDQHTGHVVAQYGGRGEKVGNRVLNRASNTYRQAGSTFKVLASFLPAIDVCGYTLASVFDDCYFVYPNSTEEVRSWYNYFKGLSTIRQGIYDSRNVVACQCMIAVTPEIGVATLQKLGISRIDTDGSDGLADFNVSIALGGLTNGCSVLEMTAAYAAIANEGIYNKPRYYTVVYDHDDNILLNNIKSSKQVMKPSTAYLLTSALVDTTKIGTGTTCKFKDLYNIPIAGKTGTAHDNVDLWFAGFTQWYTAVIWSGYDNNLPQTNNQYYRYLWRYIMEDVHKLKGYGYDENGKLIREEDLAFPMPSSIVTASICTKCGKLAVPGLCDAYAGGNCIKEEFFENGTQPYELCTCHERVVICDESGQRASSTCPSTHSRVLLKKTETPESIAHGGTSDTAYVVSSSYSTCSIHGAGWTPTPTPDPGAVDGGGGTPDGGGGTPDGGAATN